MGKKTHVNIPIFIPEVACPNRCVYCNQFKITDTLHAPRPNEIKTIIESYLSTIKVNETRVEVAFFGGNFTGLPLQEQITFLESVEPFFDKGIQGIRLSTRPDYLNKEKVALLKKHKVVEVELGIQSTNPLVLQNCQRGYGLKEIESAVKLLSAAEIPFGMQMMIGLPGGIPENEMKTAEDICQWGAVSTRIYPLIPIEDTPLFDLIRNHSYIPLSLHQAVERTKPIMLLFEIQGIKILRIGLHLSENLSVLQEPYHPAFGQLVKTSVWEDIFKNLLENQHYQNEIHIEVSPNEKVYAIGYQSSNLKRLQSRFKKACINSNPKIEGRNYHVDYR